MLLPYDSLTNLFLVCEYCCLMQHAQLANIMTATWTHVMLHVPQKGCCFSNPVPTKLIDICL